MTTYIGVDIGNRYTKVIELEYKPVLKLITDIIFRTPFLPREELGKDQLDIEVFWQRVTKSIPLERIKAATIAVNIPSNAVMAATLYVPRMAKHELTVVAQTEARRKMIPASGPNHIFESSLVGEKIINKLPRFEVLAVRTEKLYVQQALDIFKKVDAFPRIISLSSCALTALFPPELLNKKDVDLAFVDIGLGSINTSIFREGKLNFFRNTAFGIKDVIQDFGNHLSLTDNEVEDIIKEKGIPEVAVDLKDKVAVAEEIMRQKYEASLKATEAGQEEEVNLLELRVLWQVHIERIIHELRRSLTYYKEQSEGRRVEYLYFLGGGCQIKNLIPILTEQLGGQWQIVLPFKNVKLAKERESLGQTDSAPIFVNATALALSFLLRVRGREIINFLPVELKKKELIATRRLVLRVTKIGLVFTLALLSISTFITNRSVDTYKKRMELGLKGVKKTVKRLRDLNEREERRKRLSLKIQELFKTKQSFYLFLNKLGSAVPEDVLVTSVSINKDNSQQYKIRMSAEVFADYEKARKIIEDFRVNLEGIFYFKNINITPIKLEKITQAVTGAGGSESQLTLPRVRAFTVSADISWGGGN